MILDDRVAVAVLRLRGLVVGAARAHDLDRHPVVVDGLRALDELEVALRASTYGTPGSAQVPQLDAHGWLGTDEVARRLGITTRAVRRRIDRGTLRAVRVGRGWRVDPDTIERTTR